MSKTSPDPEELVARLAASLGISHLRLRVLQIAARDGYCTGPSLAKELGVTRGNLTAPIKSFVETGIFIPEPDPEARKSGGGHNRLRWRIDHEMLRRMLAALDDSVA